ncbi:polysaccharide biosynthesis/export family protein [Muriicola sp. Z0-33]|uniref:polysaccharide biosynthesis/export family protein n=1 Tax=Muriicola sp. Z0-33 TaxID=2816957 RepID=UPI002238DFA5|nr:polysaccharide biosynthesis/export family protein [Muriicola sp. Z0-33]MCW5515673.1 polysaccharide biosynthesis/export family protein [Muriicola sp. Z0-33]
MKKTLSNKTGIKKYVSCATWFFRIGRRGFPLLVLLMLSSCYTSRNVNYLQSDKRKLSIPVYPTVYAVQPNDVLNIKIQSRDPEQATFFNLSTLNTNRNNQANPANLFLSGYPVTQEGTIKMAVVGELQVAGKTVEEIRDLVQSEIDKYLLNAMVLVKLTSFKISVLGDVKNPGTNYVFNTQSTIFEALSAAGDLNLTAKRKGLKLIRQQGDESIVVDLDLTDPSIIQSPYYFLHPNDVLYVEPSKQNLLNNNLGLFSVLLSAVSTTILVLNFVSNN